MYEVMIVCSGNTCRSPMAAALMREALQVEGLAERVAVDSAGVNAFPHDNATIEAQRAMEELGLDISDHSSKRFTPETEADLILTMTTGHKQLLLQELPELTGKVFTLKEYATKSQTNPDLNVSDPYGGDDTVYRDTAAEIKKYVDKAVNRLKKEL